MQYLLLQVLEYYPSPWNTWVKIGNLPTGRALHAVLPIGPQHVACVAGEALVALLLFLLIFAFVSISNQKSKVRDETQQDNWPVKHTLCNLLQ